MTLPSSLASDVQKSSLGRYVQLFDLDARSLGGSIYYFVPGTLNDAPIVWRSKTYNPFPVKAEGFEINAKGGLPTPTLTISNVTMAMMSAVLQWNNLEGAVVTRWRTLAKYLDGLHDDVHFPKDVYVVERKTDANKQFIKWQLCSVLDMHGKRLPHRQVIRDYCNHRYRIWSASQGQFLYRAATCKYTGSSYWDRYGRSTVDPSEDCCGKRLSDCKLRFPGSRPLPSRAFPGVGRNRVRF